MARLVIGWVPSLIVMQVRGKGHAFVGESWGGGVENLLVQVGLVFRPSNS